MAIQSNLVAKEQTTNNKCIKTNESNDSNGINRQTLTLPLQSNHHLSSNPNSNCFNPMTVDTGGLTPHVLYNQTNYQSKLLGKSYQSPTSPSSSSSSSSSLTASTTTTPSSTTTSSLLPSPSMPLLSSSSSLMLAINRFKHAVNNMRNTVLIPIRLNDLEPPLLDSDPIKSSTRSSPIHPTTPLTDLIEEINAEEELLAYEIDACDDEYEADPNDLIDNVNTLNGNEGKIFAPPSSNQSTFVQAASNKQTNLYEQFKLLDLIDKILSYDSFAKISFNPKSKPPPPPPNDRLFHHDRNNNPVKRWRNIGSDDCSYRSSSSSSSSSSVVSANTELDNDLASSEISTDDHRFVANKTLNKSNSKAFRKWLMDNNFRTTTYQEHPMMMMMMMMMMNDVEDHDDQSSINDCSLLKIKRKFEFHLNSLRTMLNIMGDGADLITKTYLDDIRLNGDEI